MEMSGSDNFLAIKIERESLEHKSKRNINFWQCGCSLLVSFVRIIKKQLLNKIYLTPNVVWLVGI